MGSAHPVQRPGTQTWVGITEEYGLNSHVEFFTYEADIEGLQPRPIGGKSADLKIPPFVHSYGVTPNYVVLPINLGMSANPNCTSFGVLCGLNGHWQGIHVIDALGEVQVFDTDPFYHVHIVNSWENETGVTLDVGGYDSSPFAVTGALDVQMYLNKTERDSNPVRATMRRVHMHTSGPLKGQATYQLFDKIPGSHTDFFRVNPKHIGLPYCYYYGTQWWHDGVNYANMAILKHDLCTDTSTYWSAVDHYVGEPFFIPNPNAVAEDDGILVFVALDGPNRRSKFVSVDAKTMTEVDGATIELEKHIPFTAHGNFFPNKAVPNTLLV
jgi:carotenoid cleavage dioxygenase-like enzyme